MQNISQAQSNKIKSIIHPHNTSPTQKHCSLQARLQKKILKLNGKYQSTNHHHTIQTMLGWAAGFIDGDGCISILKQKNIKKCGSIVNRYNLSITITQNDLSTLQYLQKIINIKGNITKTRFQKGHTRQCWVLTYTGEIAYQVLLLIQAGLYRKQQECAVGLHFQQHKRMMKRMPKRGQHSSAARHLELCYRVMKTFK